MEDLLIILQELEESFLLRMRNLEGLSDVQLVQFASQVDFFAELERAGLSDALTKIENDYQDIVSDLLKKADGLNVQIGTLNLNDLQDIASTDFRAILRSFESSAEQFRSKFLKGLITGQSTREIIEGMQNLGLPTNQLVAAVNTARDEFQATATARIFEDNPEQRFKLTGPLDIKTRCQCRAVLEGQPKEGLTKSEIDAGAWTRIAKSNCPKYIEQLTKGQTTEYTFVNRGGFNCRHWNEPV